MIHKLNKLAETDNNWSNLKMIGISTEEHYQWLWEVYLHYGEVKRILSSKRAVGIFGGREAAWGYIGYTPPEIEVYVSNLGKMIGQLYIPTKEIENQHISDIS
jgi:hypothetical protein